VRLYFHPPVVVKRCSQCLNQPIEEKTVAWAFDTLGYAKRLRDGGVPNPQAEAHAEAAREFIMTELVTKQDFQTAINSLEARLEAKIDTLTLRLTVRLGGIVAAGFGILTVAIGTMGLFLRLH
jgi:hypothetical protein